MPDDQSSDRYRTVRLAEYDTSEPLALSDAASDALERLNEDATRISVSYTRDGDAHLQSRQYVGALQLPDGPTVRVEPKAAGTNFLRLLTYAHGVEASTVERETRGTGGSWFVDALAALFLAELDTVLQRGPHREYRRRSDSESQLRGHLDVQRQLQRQVPAGTDFEVTYDDLTTDTVANRALYQAGRRLSRLVRDDELSRTLQRKQQRLRQWVEPEPVRASEVAAIETDRLNAHYETILGLAEQVLRSTYLEDFRSDGSQTYGLLVDMNRVFEKVVERAAREALEPYDGWTVATQSRVDPIVTGGEPRVNLYPDFVVRHEGSVRLVGDAKWKTDRISQSDIYQMTSYQLKDGVPGVLVYPEQEASVETEYTVKLNDGKLPLKVITLPTRGLPGGGGTFVDALVSSMREEFRETLEFA